MFPTRAQEQMWAGRRKNQWTLSQQILSRLRSRKKNEWRKNEQILRELLETMKCINLCIMGAPEKGRVIILSFHFCFVFCPSSFLYFSSTLIAPILTRPFKTHVYTVVSLLISITFLASFLTEILLSSSQTYQL